MKQRLSNQFKTNGLEGLSCPDVRSFGETPKGNAVLPGWLAFV